jgi:ribulose-5-phosphate 4-epimerase/fuculose-1-phosphate aldolase
VIPEIPYYLSKIGKVRRLPPGSDILAQEVAEEFQNEEVSAVLMQSHGIITTGRTFKETIQKTLFLELACRIAMKTTPHDILWTKEGNDI